MGGRQRESRKSKMERLVDNVAVTDFILNDKHKITLISEIGKREGTPADGYILKKYGIHIPINNIKMNGYERGLTVNVPQGSYIEKQLKELGKLK